MATTPELIAYLQEKIPLGQLPETVKLSELLWHEMDKLWQMSVVNIESGVVVEWGGLLVIQEGELALIELTEGTDTHIRLVVPALTDFVGSFHTHPHASGYTGIGFSGADFADMVNQGERVSVVQSGQHLFMILRTENTPATTVVNKWRVRMNSLFEQSYKERQDILAASLVANQTISRELGLAFYYGWAFRQLVEVYRP